MINKTKTDFKAHALEHFRHIEETGETIIVTYHGKPVIEVRPYCSEKRLPMDILRGSVIRYDAQSMADAQVNAGSAD